MNGKIAVVEGTRINGQWDWKVYHGTFGSPQGTMKTETVKQVTDLRAPVAARQPGFWEKTANFASRTFNGAFGAGLSFAAGAAMRHLVVGPQTYTHSKLCEMGMYAAGLGLASAVVTSEPESAFVRGGQFGVLTQLVAGSGFGNGESYDKAALQAGEAYNLASKTVSESYKYVSDQAGAFGTSASAKVSDVWASVKGFVNSKIVAPACSWSNGGRVASFLGCDATSQNGAHPSTP